MDEGASSLQASCPRLAFWVPRAHSLWEGLPQAQVALAKVIPEFSHPHTPPFPVVVFQTQAPNLLSLLETIGIT